MNLERYTCMCLIMRERIGRMSLSHRASYAGSVVRSGGVLPTLCRIVFYDTPMIPKCKRQYMKFHGYRVQTPQFPHLGSENRKAPCFYI